MFELKCIFLEKLKWTIFNEDFSKAEGVTSRIFRIKYMGICNPLSKVQCNGTVKCCKDPITLCHCVICSKMSARRIQIWMPTTTIHFHMDNNDSVVFERLHSITLIVFRHGKFLTQVPMRRIQCSVRHTITLTIHLWYIRSNIYLTMYFIHIFVVLLLSHNSS